MLPHYDNCISPGHLAFGKNVVFKAGSLLKMSVLEAGTTVATATRVEYTGKKMNYFLVSISFFDMRRYSKFLPFVMREFFFRL